MSDKTVRIEEGTVKKGGLKPSSGSKRPRWIPEATRPKGAPKEDTGG